MKSTQFHWYADINNMVILSRLYTQPMDMSKMFEVFSVTVWTLILLSTISVALFVYFYNYFKGLLFNIRDNQKEEGISYEPPLGICKILTLDRYTDSTTLYEFLKF